MDNLFLLAQILLSSLLIGIVLIQTGTSGLGRAWGQTVSFTRRGLEKYLFRATFVISILFLIISILSVTL